MDCVIIFYKTVKELTLKSIIFFRGWIFLRQLNFEREMFK